MHKQKRSKQWAIALVMIALFLYSVLSPLCVALGAFGYLCHRAARVTELICLD